jgi:hypothetical protein
MYCILDLHLIVKVRRLNMQHKKTICKEKKNTTKREEPTNKSTKTLKLFWDFLI